MRGNYCLSLSFLVMKISQRGLVQRRPVDFLMNVDVFLVVSFQMNINKPKSRF